MPRLDQYLVLKGLAASRSLGVKMIKGGHVTVNGATQTKVSFLVEEGDEVLVEESEVTRFVSRGGLKLEKALTHWDIRVEGLLCADIGASTGGFTHCLLERGAKKVFAVDSGSDQLHPTLRSREDVVSFENVNARYLDEGLFGKVDLVVMDVSFISQSLLYPAVRKILLPHGVFISLIKPQFEVGREHLSSGGIVKNEKARAACPEKLREAGEREGLILKEVIPSPIEGGDGNVEYLALFVQKEKEAKEETL